MRKFAILGWLLLPIAAFAYHYGPGQSQLQMDDAAQAVARAREEVDAENWSGAVAAYQSALSCIPVEQHLVSQQVRLELAKARMLNHQLPTAHTELEALLDDVMDPENGTPAQLLHDTRSALANSQYYMTWLMRLEGAPQEEWEKSIDASRQHYKWLADQARKSKDNALLNSAQHDMESAIRLARMDLGELQGLPIPSQ